MMKTIQNLSKSVFVLLFLFVCSCSDDSDIPGDRATLLGRDLRECVMCCGGWLIEIGEEQYRFGPIPFSAMVDFENETFPVEVAVIWNPINGDCEDEIEVLNIQKIE
ncbi:MAG: hypothetical protein R8G66_30495 [Cytophagales bacterium]|nr:hypothetical protein [Cytophagales bacterium]